jgi:hypothetical protein
MTLDEFCRYELELFERRLADLKSGRLKFSHDGYSWAQATADEITQTQARMAEPTPLA